jgi:hypothetical protein
MAVNLLNFLHSLARYVVTRAAAHAGGDAELHRRAAAEPLAEPGGAGDAADPYTVFRYGPGPALSNDPLPRASVQVFTSGTDPEAVLTRAQTIFEALCGDDAKAQIAARMLVIDGYKLDDTADGHWLIVSIDPLQRPGFLPPAARSGKRRASTLDIGFVKKD